MRFGGRGEHAEVEATLELVLLCLLASTVSEAFGFSEAALAELQVSVLWLRGPSEAACDICLLVHVAAEAAGSRSQQRCDVVALHPWTGAEALRMEPALVVADPSQEQKQQPPGWPGPSCSGSCSSASRLQTVPPDLQMVL